jgi:hypothetical protein
MTDFSLGERTPFNAQEQAQTEAGQPMEFTYSYMTEKARALIASWKQEQDDTDRRRRQRKIEVSLEALRQQGRLKMDETLLGIRVIDENIRKEQPLFMNYLTGARRAAIFKNKETPIEDIERLENEVTEGLRYKGWIDSYFSVTDGAQLHGWDSVEVVYDEKKPLQVSLEHIGHDDLLFPLDSLDIQACAFILRRYHMSPMTLMNMVADFGFDAAQVNTLVEEAKKQGMNVPKNICVYKIQFKVNRVVYVGWIEPNKGTDWLKKPAPLFVGRRKLTQEIVPTQQTIVDPTTGLPTAIEVPQTVEKWVDEYESIYFVSILRYSQTEEKAIAEQKGHAFYDLPYQEASTALASLFINGSVRASNIFASWAKGTGTGSMPKKMDMDLEHGCVYSEPISFWNPPYPDPSLLRGLQFLDVRKQQESGNLAAAVVNRDDSRKTAEEIETAKEETNKLGSVQLVLYSGFVGDVLSLQWYIIQNLSLQGQVKLLQKPVPDAMGVEILQNDMETLSRQFEVLPSGDTDVIKRAERIQKRMMLLPVVGHIPELAIELIKDLLREILPEDSARYITVLESSLMFNKDAMIMALAGMLEQAVTDERGQIKPEFAQFAPQLAQMKQIIMQQQAASQTQQAGHASANPGASGQQKMIQNNMMSQQMSPANNL